MRVSAVIRQVFRRRPPACGQKFFARAHAGGRKKSVPQFSKGELRIDWHADGTHLLAHRRAGSLSDDGRRSFHLGACACDVRLKVLVEETYPPDARRTRGLRVQTAPVEVQQVLVNLLLNAARAMKNTPSESRHIEIETRSVDRTSKVSIRDHGWRIPEEHLDKIFDPFYTTKSSGLGMGLAICRPSSKLTADASKHGITNPAVRRFRFRFQLLSSGEPHSCILRSAQATECQGEGSVCAMHGAVCAPLRIRLCPIAVARRV